MNNQIQHSDNQSLRDAETIEAGTFWYHIPHKQTYIAVKSTLVGCEDDINVPDRLLFSLNNGNIFSFEDIFGSDVSAVAGRENFVQVTRPFTVTPFPIKKENK
jgi:hypothetical protein